VKASAGPVGGVETPNRLNLVAEEIEADRIGLAGREQVDDRAAHRIVAGVMDGIGPLIAVCLQQPLQRIALDPLAFGQPARQLTDAERGYQALRCGICGGDQQLRAGPLRLQRVQRRHALGHHSQRRRAAVIREAVPGWEGHDLDFGCEDRDRVGQRPHRRFVGGDDHGARAAAHAMCCPRQVSGQPGQEAGRHAAQRQRLIGTNDALESLAHLGAFK